MERYLLKLLDAFAWVFKVLKVDYYQLRAIVGTKLIMDNRRQVVGYNNKDRTEATSAFVVTLFLYAVIGALVAFAMHQIPSFIFSMIVFFSYIMVMVSMTLITDFSSILLDTSDNTIVLPRPVDGRTLFAARLTHILLYLGQLAAGLSLVPAVVVVFQYGAVLLGVFLLAIALAICFAVFLTNALYLLVINFATEEKVKSIINYVQIFMAVAIMGGYQVLPRMMERMNMETFVFKIQWWGFLLPPVWMAGAMEAFRYQVFDGAHLGLTACAVIIPLWGVFLVNKYLSPVFNRKLSSLSGQVDRNRAIKEKNNGVPNMSRWLTTTPAERGAFDIIYKILGRDRKLKLKIYPAFGYVLVFGLIFMIRSQEDLLTTWHNLPATQYHLVLLYLIFMVLQVALYEIPYSDDFKASWVYYSAPLANPGEILSATLKAICVRLFLPAYLAISICVWLVWGFRVTGDIVFGLLNNLIMVMILALINKRCMPFSMPPNVRAQSGNLVRNILTFLIIALLGACHFLLTQRPLVLMASIPIQLLGLHFLHRAYKRTPWSGITL